VWRLPGSHIWKTFIIRILCLGRDERKKGMPPVGKAANQPVYIHHTY